MDDDSGQLGINGIEIGYLVSGKNGVRFEISKVAELPPRGAVIQPVTQFVLHSRLLAFAYLKDYYNQTNNSNQSFFRTFPLDNDNLQTFITKLTNNYNRVLQLDFNQVFSNHPNSTDRIFPENFSSSIIQYFKNTIHALNSYSSQAVSDNPLPEYIFNLLTSKVYD